MSPWREIAADQASCASQLAGGLALAGGEDLSPGPALRCAASSLPRGGWLEESFSGLEGVWASLEGFLAILSVSYFHSPP